MVYSEILANYPAYPVLGVMILGVLYYNHKLVHETKETYWSFLMISISLLAVAYGLELLGMVSDRSSMLLLSLVIVAVSSIVLAFSSYNYKGGRKK